MGLIATALPLYRYKKNAQALIVELSNYSISNSIVYSVFIVI